MDQLQIYFRKFIEHKKIFTFNPFNPMNACMYAVLVMFFYNSFSFYVSFFFLTFFFQTKK